MYEFTGKEEGLKRASVKKKSIQISFHWHNSCFSTLNYYVSEIEWSNLNRKLLRLGQLEDAGSIDKNGTRTLRRYLIKTSIGWLKILCKEILSSPVDGLVVDWCLQAGYATSAGEILVNVVPGGVLEISSQMSS